MMLQALAQRASPPDCRAGDAGKWRKVARFGYFSSIRTPVYKELWEATAESRFANREICNIL
jgi:hypothetical protein